MDSTESLFYTGLYTTLASFLIAVVGFLYKSKCKHFQCCGISIDRDIETELREDIEIIHRSPVQDSRTSLDRPPV
jgi:hypothetical protein